MEKYVRYPHILKVEIQNGPPEILTEDEINDIVDESIIYAPGADDISRSVFIQSVKETLKYRLEGKMLCKIQINELKKKIKVYHEYSIVHPGTTVALAAAAAVGEFATQATLNTFKVAGSSKIIGSGIEGMKDILNSRQIKDPICTIYFHNNPVYYNILEYRALIVGSVFEDFIIKSDIIEYKEIPDDYWYKLAWHECFDWDAPEQLQNRVINYWVNNEDDETFLDVISIGAIGWKGTWPTVVEIMTKRPETPKMIERLCSFTADINWPGAREAWEHLIIVVGMRAIPIIDETIAWAKENGDDWCEDLDWLKEAILEKYEEKK